MLVDVDGMRVVGIVVVIGLGVDAWVNIGVGSVNAVEVVVVGSI